ncbi:hypothetical protein [Acetanaerobacterium elongatum]|uniref:DUF2383 domain-containing protein n=1 Tax=Acetanaerobacterium elongatum TaxID=258515 RepID=A0A1H0GWB2_9FIRM|nr:hypothetical protein [Acetanaerobacterium elongatum]SDO11177.1 hypothetical protein SAMN05192585_15612 [Acetanaerobacterium elongatum]
MNGNAELLNFIYQNAQMGTETIKQILDIVKDDDFSKHLSTQYDEYKQILSEARTLLNQNGYDEKGISAFEKLRTYLSINMQTLTDQTPSHISEMLIIGSNMGVVNAIKNLKHYPNADAHIRSLMERLLQSEENNIQQLKIFL